MTSPRTDRHSLTGVALDLGELEYYTDVVLRAAADAELSTDDVNRAAHEAVNLDRSDFGRVVSNLLDRRLVRGSLVTVEEVSGPVDGHIERLTPLGREDVRQRPPVKSLYLGWDEKGPVEVFIQVVVKELEAGALRLSANDRADLEAQIESLQGQLRSPKPRRSIVTGIVAAVKLVAANVAADAITNGATNLLHLLR